RRGPPCLDVESLPPPPPPFFWLRLRSTTPSAGVVVVVVMVVTAGGVATMIGILGSRGRRGPSSLPPRLPPSEILPPLPPGCPTRRLRPFGLTMRTTLARLVKTPAPPGPLAPNQPASAEALSDTPVTTAASASSTRLNVLD